MKIIYSVIAGLVLCFSLNAQHFNQAFKIASANTERGMRITSDKNGDVVTTGYFGGTADFDPSAVSQNMSPWNSSTDVYLAKYDSLFNYKWAIKIGGSQADFSYGLAADSSNNILVAGDFAGTLYFNSSFSPGTFVSSSGTLDRDGFVAKYDTSGNFIWGIRLGSTGKDVVYGVKTDAVNNVYVTGYFEGTVDFDPSSGTHNLISNGGRDIFLAKYDSAGNFIWAFHEGGVLSTAYEEGGEDLVIKGANIYLTGNFEGTVDFNPGAAVNNLISNGSLDFFIAKYDTAGNYNWAISAGSASYHDYSYGIDIDASQNVYVTGAFESTVDFDPSASTANLTAASSPGQDIFVAKYSSSGIYQWAFQIGGNTSVDEDGFDIDVNTSGDIYVTGSFWGPADFDPSAGSAMINSSNNQAFVAKYNSSGNYQWAFEIGSTAVLGPADNGFGISVLDNGKFYLTGDFYGNADFDPSFASYSLNGDNMGHAFVASYNGDQTTSISALPSAENDVSIFPNPSSDYAKLTFKNPANEKRELLLTDISGKTIMKIENITEESISIDTKDLNSGMYFCTISTGENIRITKKLIVQ